MSTEANIAVTRRYFTEFMNAGRLEVVDEIVTPDFTFHITTLPEAIRGPAGLKGFAQGLRTGFPNVRFEIVAEIAEGEKVQSRWHLSGTHQGEFLGIPATGRPLRDHGYDIFHLRDGRIAEMWVNEDSLGLLRQLGVLPPPPSNAAPADPDALAARAAAHAAGRVHNPATVAANKAVVHRFYDEIMNGGNLATVDAIIAPEFFFTIPTHAPAYGPGGFKGVVQMLHTAFPDIHFQVEDELGEGEYVGVRWTATGTHQGDFLSNPPSGRSFSIQGISKLHVVNGQLVENLVNEDSLGLLMQIGIITMPSN